MLFSLICFRMDDIKKGLNSIKSKIEDKAEGICQFLDFFIQKVA